ncbi:hypothetical protein HPP92_014755 [Vanilla planifolia]|uniref:Methyltransferase n=1 Tax=Vanilla planifolia TaxID=51239 RepID=A0A835UT14_VANPL|nr:hypothetical protein HPP92_014755 [Vanilla planifolia]
MDRILRPTGFVIVRDSVPWQSCFKKYFRALHWELVAAVDSEADSNPEDGEIILLIQKKMWFVDESLKD